MCSAISTQGPPLCEANLPLKKEILRADGQLLATAYHEAGHAVAYLVQSLSVSSVIIVATDEFYGVCRSPSVMGYYFDNWRERRQIARAIIVATYAGLPAEKLFDPNAADLHGSSDDANAFEISRTYQVLPRYCSYVGDDSHWAYLERLRAEARRLVARQRRAIARLAEELFQHRTLDGDQVSTILEGQIG